MKQCAAPLACDGKQCSPFPPAKRGEKNRDLSALGTATWTSAWEPLGMCLLYLVTKPPLHPGIAMSPVLAAIVPVKLS